MTTLIHTTPRGHVIEYRRNPSDPAILSLEHRELRPDGMPYNDRWYPVNDSHLLNLQLQPRGTEIIDRLLQEDA